MTKTMAFRLVEGVVVVAHGYMRPSEEDYDAYIEFCQALPLECNRYMILTPGTGPNPAQRKRTTDAIKGRRNQKVQVAIVTDAQVVRGIATALSWFSSGIRAFSTANVAEAWAYLGVTSTQVGHIMLEARKLQAEVQTLPQLEVG